MNKHLVIVSVVLLVLSWTLLILSGCNTWHGAGKDVERAGEKMQ